MLIPQSTICQGIWELAPCQPSDMPLNIGRNIAGVGVKNPDANNEILILTTPEEENPL